MRFLRSIGKPSFITTKGVIQALVDANVLSAAPKGIKDLRQIQDAFTAWSEQSGLDFTSISRVLAMSVGESADEPARTKPIYITPSLA